MGGDGCGLRRRILTRLVPISSSNACTKLRLCAHARAGKVAIGEANEPAGGKGRGGVIVERSLQRRTETRARAGVSGEARRCLEACGETRDAEWLP